jgi:Domain of unknown function (DUF5606)
MNLEKFVAISGLAGIYKMVGSRPNGMIVEHLMSKKREFIPTRGHQFTPLESIAIFVDTEEDSVPLKNLFRSMLEQVDSNPPAAPNGDAKEIKAYFESVLPTYDRDRVMIHDMKKAIKWFKFMNEAGVLSLEEDEVAEEVATETVA